MVAQITASGGKAIAVQGNVSSESDVVWMFDTVQETFGPVTALVNNAGILETQTRVENMDAARLRRVLETNVVGSFLCAAEAVRRMSTRHGGPGGGIVNVSSRASVLGSPGEYVDYAMSKGAIDTLTIGLAKEVAAEGIRVNAVRPGIIDTDIHASGGEPGRVEATWPGATPGARRRKWRRRSCGCSRTRRLTSRVRSLMWRAAGNGLPARLTGHPGW